MELTGKCKEDFGKWFRGLNLKYTPMTEITFNLEFNKLTESMQWGVCEDFFASHDIYFQIWHTFYKNGINHEWQIMIYDKTDEYFTSNHSTAQYGDNHEYPTMGHLRKSALKMANEIYNKIKEME